MWVGAVFTNLHLRAKSELSVDIFFNLFTASAACCRVYIVAVQWRRYGREDDCVSTVHKYVKFLPCNYELTQLRKSVPLSPSQI